MLHDTAVPGFRPMEAAKEHGGELMTTCLIQPKMDGIRCVTMGQNGQRALSRTLKPIPNTYVQTILNALPVGLDGELMLVKRDGGKLVGYADYNDTQSAIMSEAGQPEFHYIVFDCLSPKLADAGYVHRFDALNRVVGAVHTAIERSEQFLRQVYSMELKDENDLPAMVDAFIAAGWEGAMTRTMDGRYKFGRSTPKEQWLVKHKRFHNMEVIVTGMEELMTNTNEKVTDARGLSKRSSDAAGKVPSGTMGALLFDGGKVGTGFTAEQRRMFWDHPELIIGKPVTVRYQELSDELVPRFPSFAGIRLD